MMWSLRYASHLGFRSFERPLFLSSVGRLDPEAHIAFAAHLGFAGVQDPWFAQRPRADQDRISAALLKHRLAAGCVVCGSLEDVRKPLWTGRGGTTQAELRSALTLAVDAARRIGSRQIAVLCGEDPGKQKPAQFAAMVDNLAWAADIAGAAGLTLCLEPTNARALPGMLMNHIADGLRIVRAVDSPRVSLIFDTAHIQSMDGDLLGNLDRCWGDIEVIQIANHPGRCEPSYGEINMSAILKAVKSRGYEGLVELEHLWSHDDEMTERVGIEWLERVDSEL